jgi:hypothetical protein
LAEDSGAKMVTRTVNGESITAPEYFTVGQEFEILLKYKDLPPDTVVQCEIKNYEGQKVIKHVTAYLKTPLRLSGSGEYRFRTKLSPAVWEHANGKIHTFVYFAPDGKWKNRLRFIAGHTGDFFNKDGLKAEEQQK